MRGETVAVMPDWTDQTRGWATELDFGYALHSFCVDGEWTRPSSGISMIADARRTTFGTTLEDQSSDGGFYDVTVAEERAGVWYRDPKTVVGFGFV